MYLQGNRGGAKDNVKHGRDNRFTKEKVLGKSLFQKSKR